MNRGNIERMRKEKIVANKESRYREKQKEK